MNTMTGNKELPRELLSAKKELLHIILVSKGSISGHSVNTYLATNKKSRLMTSSDNLKMTDCADNSN